MGDVLMPALLTKDQDLQAEITKVLPVMACMSLGPYEIVMNTSEERMGHIIFENEAVKVSVICSNCHDSVKDAMNSCIKICSESNVPHSSIATMTGVRNLFAKFVNFKHYVDLESTQYWAVVEGLCHHYYVFSYGAPTDVLNVENSSKVLKALKPFIDDTMVCMNRSL